MLIKYKKYMLIHTAILVLYIFGFSTIALSAPKNIFSKPRTIYRPAKPAIKKAEEKVSKPKKEIKEEEKPQELDDPAVLTIPSDLGTVIQVWQPAEDGRPKIPTIDTPLIVHLQDAHANINAQKKEAEILDHIIKKYSLHVILVEGGITDKDYSYLRERFPLAERKQRAQKLLDEGTITAESYIDMATDYPLKFQGIEDKGLYEKNMEAFLKIDKFKEGGLEVLHTLQTAVETLKPAVYPPVLKELEKARQDYETERISLSEYVLRLKERAGASKTDCSKYPNFNAMAGVVELEPKIDFKTVESQRSALIENLTRRLSPAKLSNLVSKSTAFKARKIGQGSYHTYLVDLAAQANIPENDYRQLSIYAEYASKNDSIDSPKLIEELERLYIETAENLARKGQERQFLTISEHLRLLIKFVELKLTPDQFEYYTARKKDFDTQNWRKQLISIAKKYSVKIATLPDTSVIPRNLSSLEEFYTTSFERDEAFIRNSIQKCKKENENKGILICGGFHTPSLTELFKKNNIAYAVVAPKVEEATDEKFYRQKLIEGYKNRLWNKLSTGPTSPAQ